MGRTGLVYSGLCGLIYYDPSLDCQFHADRAWSVSLIVIDPSGLAQTLVTTVG